MSQSVSDYLRATVAYADIFNYPLTQDHIRRWCIRKRLTTSSIVKYADGIEHKNGYFFLSGRQHIITLNTSRRIAAEKKWHIARRIGNWLKYIPTIRLVGVTGGLALNNTDPKDDIDIFIITSANTLWISRLLATLFVDVFGKRRKPGQTELTDKICLNMYMSEDAVLIPNKERDLFVAHEVLQMEPLWYRDTTYKSYLYKNRWTKYYLPNAWKYRVEQLGDRWHQLGHKTQLKNMLIHIGEYMLGIIEVPVRIIQIWYMHERRTTEVIRHDVVRFHPNDARVWVKNSLEKRCIRLNIPLDKLFYES